MSDVDSTILRQSTSEFRRSGSWSDVSDCGNGLEGLPLGPSTVNGGSGVGGPGRPNGAESQYERDVNDRLSQSLDLGHGSFSAESKDFDSLPNDTWDGESARSHSLPHRRHLMVNGNDSPGSGSGTEMEELDQSDKIKNKLMSAWNNVRHGWTVRMRTSFRQDKPIWLLGQCYFPNPEERAEQKRMAAVGRSVITTYDKFKFDFTSRFWFTYRQDFPPLLGTQVTTDVGWGCMLRTGQMLLAQALQLHFLGRDWRWQHTQRQQQDRYHKLIVRLFSDQPSDQFPFSIHRLVRIGQEMGKKPGDWFGPNSVAHVLREAVDRAPECNPILGQLCLYVAQDCTVYKQDVIDLCTQSWPNSRRDSVRRGSESSEHSVDITTTTPEPAWRALVLLIPIRLGGEGLNPIYITCIQNMLTDPICLGFIGGKPKHSVYFVGWQEEKLVYLDPHFCQDTVPMGPSDRDYPVTYHCMSPRKMSFTKMDPSCTVGFYCKTREDFDQFVQRAQQMCAPPQEKGQYPMFVFSRGRMCDASLDDSKPGPDRLLRVRHLDKKGRVKLKDSEDFVFL